MTQQNSGMTDQPAPGHVFVERISSVPREFDQAAADRALEGIIGQAPADSPLHALIAMPQVSALLRGVFSGSPFLSDIALRDSASLAAILSENPDDRLDGLCSGTAQALAGVSDIAVAMPLLRHFRASAALLIGLADLASVWTIDEVTAALSRVADLAIGQGLNVLLRAEAAKGRLTPPNPEDPGEASGLIVLGMGKLGAHELNFSSDIDLIVFFDPDIAPVTEGIEPQTLFVRVTRDLVKLLQERTGEGYVFRVDLRLRPDPGATNVAISVLGALQYYESLGQNWERAAMIKARPVAGDLEAGKTFLRDLRPFIWRKYLDYAAIADVHAMKRQIHAHRGHGSIATAGHNIKLGRGGIREVEFFVQTQQLIAGGRQPALRERQTVAMLELLSASGWITGQAAAELASAYRYLRRIEHRLQMRRDEQTHTLPDEGEAFEAFAAFCGYASPGDFSEELLRNLSIVQAHYAALFEDEPELAGASGSLVFTGDDDDPETLATLARMGFASPSDVTRTVRGWHFGRYPAMRSAKAREQLTKMVPLLLSRFAATSSPQAALLAFDGFLARLPAGAQLFALLRANPGLLSLLIDILGTAPRLARLLGRRAHIIDALLDPGFFGGVPSRDDLDERLDATLAEARGYEELLDRARLFGQEQSFLIGARVLSGSIDAGRAGSAYAALAGMLVQRLHGAAERMLEAVYGKMPGGSVAVVAMGKLGGMEMTASSDLDLILIYDTDAEDAQSDGKRALSATAYYTRLTQRLVAALASPTAEGSLYEVDMRLRPSGNAGPVATSLSSFRAYHRDNAWTWEHMALTRARVLSGSGEFMALVEKEIHGILVAPRSREKTASDVLEMRARIAAGKGSANRWALKAVPGGLIDIEFIAQFLQLVHAAETPAILDRNTASALAKLHAAGFLETGDAEALIAACTLYHNLTQVLRLALDGEEDIASAPRGLHQLLARAAALPDFAILEPHLDETQASVRAIFTRILGASLA